MALVMGLMLSSCVVMSQRIVPTNNEVPSGQIRKVKANMLYVYRFIPIGVVSFEDAIKNSRIEKVIAVENKTTDYFGLVQGYEIIIYGE